MKKQNGITLIALIITIIVMLILAGVTIAVALNGGLFEKAQFAGNKTQIEAEREVLQSAAIGALDKDELKILNKQVLESNLPIGWVVTGTLQDGYTARSPKENIFIVESNGTVKDKTEVELIDGSLYQKVVENPDAYIGAKVTGYTAQGYSEWVIYDASSDGYVRLVPKKIYDLTNAKYTYDSTKTNAENLSAVQAICNQYINLDLATSSTLLTVEEYHAYYNGIANYSGWGFIYNASNNSLSSGTGGEEDSAVRKGENCGILMIIKLKPNVMVKDGGSKDTGYEIYI